MPKYIGPYKIIDMNATTSNYTLELPQELKDCCIHPKFHVSLLWRHEPNDDAMFPNHEARAFHDFGNNDQQEWLVNESIGHEWGGQ